MDRAGAFITKPGDLVWEDGPDPARPVSPDTITAQVPGLELDLAAAGGPVHG